MPCRSDGYPDYRTEGLIAKNEELTRMLCSLLRTLNDTIQLPPDVEVWWRGHQKWDKSQGRT